MTDAHLTELRELARLAVATKTGLALSPHVLAGLIDHIDRQGALPAGLSEEARYRVRELVESAEAALACADGLSCMSCAENLREAAAHARDMHELQLSSWPGDEVPS